MTGKRKWSVVSGQWSASKVADACQQPAVDPCPPTLSLTPGPRPPAPSSRGFTLLELMIVISIIVILAVIAMPQYQKSVIHAKETVLRDDLHQMRKLLDQYAADKGKLPQSLDDLVSAGYMRDIPVDPITGEKDWQTEVGEDPASIDGGQGLTNVRSASPERSTEGTAYNEW